MDEKPTEFEQLMTISDPALLIVTTAVEGCLAGCVVGFHAQSSMDPPRFCFWLSKANHTYALALRAEYFAAHFVPGNDRALARLFGTTTGEQIDKFAHVEHTLNSNGVPLLHALPNRLELRRLALVDLGGDHVAIECEMLHASAAEPFTPLRDSAAQDFEPGHDPRERAVDP